MEHYWGPTMLEKLKQSAVDWLLSPRVRYSVAAMNHRALHQHLHGEDVLEKALLLQCVNGVRGDFLEFGVFEGRSLMHAYFYVRYLTHLIETGTVPILAGVSTEPLRAMRFVGFDSFEGLPEPTYADTLDGQQEWLGAGSFACSEERFWGNLKRNKVERERFVAVPGWYEQSLSEATVEEHGMRSAAVVHIDCDYYHSTVLALDFVTNLLVDGSILVFDDWFLYRGRADKGEQRAFAEWREQHPQFRVTELHRSTTVSFQVHR